MSPSSQEDRRKEIEAWWALIARILAFFLGAMILAYQTLATDQDRVLLLLISATLMGPMIVAGLSQLLVSLRGGSQPGGGENGGGA